MQISIVLIFLFLVNVLCAPFDNFEDAEEFYDQRQNGTENWRIDVKDVVVVVAPLQKLMGTTVVQMDDLGSSQKSAKDGLIAKLKGLKIRLPSFLVPLLKRQPFPRKSS